MEDRSALFNQLKNFSQRKLKKVETKVVTASGENLVEKRGAKGLQVLTGGQGGATSDDAEPPRKLDLQVGMVLPGFLIGSNDVAHDKSSLESYGVTHVLNLDADVENKFEDDYNYKNITMHDKPDFELDKVLEDCYDFIDDGRHYGNVLIHCAGTIGLSRSTAVCIGYLMNKEKQKFDEAFNNVKEARSFVRPNEGFIKQLKDYEVKLRGAQEIKDSGIDDPFALKKKQEIEAEKAMVAGAASVKNRMKMFGATLDTGGAARSKSVSPSPAKMQTTGGSSNANSPSPAPSSRWSANKDNFTPDGNKSISKSMTPEPRKSWQSPTTTTTKIEQPPAVKSSGGPPPPPPPMPTSLFADDKPSNSSSRSAATAAGLPPPPPPPPAGDLLKGSTASQSKPSSTSVSRPLPAHKSERRQSTESHNSDSSGISESGNKQRMVFGRVPPPPMKISGGLSIEKHDHQSDRVLGFNKSTPQSKASLQLPLKRQPTTDSSGDCEASDKTRAPSPSAALRAVKQQVASGKQADDQPHKTTGQLNRSSTKKLLNLIKTKTKSDLTLPDGDENDEIEALLGALESESIDNIDWDELGLDEDEVKDIIQGGGDLSPSSASSSSSNEEESEEEEEEVETSNQHFVIRTK